MSKFYITTTLPYVNAAPHIGFALETVQADVIARYKRLLGEEVVFNTGTDEHGQKIYEKALEERKDPQVYVDEYAAKFEELKKVLNLSYTNFIRTSDPHHKKAAREFWKLCDRNGDIYKKNYKVKYCVGCELEKTDSELDGGHCPLHPNLKIEEIDEENYFFRFSKYQDELLKLYGERPDFVLPDFRLKEIRNFVDNGLQDFSISRLKEKMPWGVPVPGDDEHVMYVWFDALVSYISALGWPSDEKKFNDFWPGVQLAGKDNLRQQSAMWQAMLMSAGLPNSKQILIHGFIESGGEKMSKSLGNIIDPYEVVEKYGTDALRYWLTREISTFGDGDFTLDKFKESYNANLANGLGNLVSRVMKMAHDNRVKLDEDIRSKKFYSFAGEISNSLESFRIKDAIDTIWTLIGDSDKYIQEKEPFKLVKTNLEEARSHIDKLLISLWEIASALEPFLPETSRKIMKALEDNSEIKTPLFPRA